MPRRLRHGIPCELHLYPNGYHGTATCDTQTIDDITEDVKHSDSWLRDACRWLKYMGIVY